MKLVKGPELPPDLKADVLRCFVHRWTHENAKQTYGGRCPACVQRAPDPLEVNGVPWHEYHVPLVSDAEWLAAHAFYVTRDGRLSSRHNHAEPAYLAEG
jgi:hypothetical protein